MTETILCKWLPNYILFQDSNHLWSLYIEKLYQVFLEDFIENTPYFHKKPIKIRINPKENHYEHAFIHLTGKSTHHSFHPNDRTFDLKRCERLRWNRAIIDHYKCHFSCFHCQKILYYEHYYKNHIRINLFFSDVRFKVILEQRKDYFLLITGYYIDFDSTMLKEQKRFIKYQEQKTPLE